MSGKISKCYGKTWLVKSKVPECCPSGKYNVSVVKFFIVFLVDLFRHGLTCGESIGKQSWSDCKYCELRTTTEILQKRAVVCNSSVNLVKDIHAPEQFLECQNLQWFSGDMDAANFSPGGAQGSSPADLSSSPWKMTLMLVFYAAAHFFFHPGPSFLFDNISTSGGVFLFLPNCISWGLPLPNEERGV